ncbi:hypothetical protein FO488_14210 [Geobacter sp. FeAm09]|uniref:hypothetical protein n=1 Tax=Geobacter sp. FeAm09 TaxID=2597769 RepID=UPI0011F02AAB|nr:hypothetical protein [Geobacter sp. FeAm09]QEM69199.1 hypothetical protein FO488_14210 [Geobacter sp. FeAm09]
MFKRNEITMLSVVPFLSFTVVATIAVSGAFYNTGIPDEADLLKWFDSAVHATASNKLTELASGATKETSPLDKAAQGRVADACYDILAVKYYNADNSHRVDRLQAECQNLPERTLTVGELRELDRRTMDTINGQHR